MEQKKITQMIKQKNIENMSIQEHEMAIHEIRMNSRMDMQTANGLILKHEKEIEKLIRQEEEDYFKW